MMIEDARGGDTNWRYGYNLATLEPLQTCLFF